jgi:hypothetical protein
MQRYRGFTEDERGIEGLPIRLIIAVVVGVAALSIMMSMLGGIDDMFGQTEATVELDNAVVDEGNTVELAAITEEGEAINDATIIVRSGTLNIDSPYDEHTGENDNTINVKIGSSAEENGVNPDWRSNQDIGTLEIHVVPPSDGNFEDGQKNPEITVIRNN